MAIELSASAQEAGRALAAAVADEPLVQELWVWTSDEGVHLGLIVPPIEAENERQLYGLADVIGEQFPDLVFELHLLNPRYFTRDDIHDSLPPGATQVAQRSR